MKYLILGDTHGNWNSMDSHILNNVIARKIEFDAIIQVGDLGYYPNSMPNFHLYVKEYKVPFHFIDGNHENHFLLNTTYKKLIPYNIIYHERGNVSILADGTKIGWMGGAFNVDREQEFWKDGSQNFPKITEIEQMIDKVNTLGGVDLMVTHSCPHSIGIGMKGSDMFTSTIKSFITPLGYKTGELWDCGDDPMTTLWKGLKVKPPEWIFGHFHTHVHSVIGHTHFHCVGACDICYGQPRVYIYDTELKKVLG